MQFTLKIESENGAHTIPDVAAMLCEVAMGVLRGETSGVIQDDSGNTVGSFTGNGLEI